MTSQQSTDQPCWCTQETFSQNLLDKIPAEMRNKACICARCVAAEQS